MFSSSTILPCDNQLEKEYSDCVPIAHRKKYAQFFTPFPIAKLMGSWLLSNNSIKSVLDPAFGLGVFSRALLSKNKELSIKGFEIDSTIFETAQNIFSKHPNIKINLMDYMFNDWDNKYDGIICNPPYFKFHDYDNKGILREIENRLSVKLNGFTNLYTLFLIKSISQLNDNGRIAYIIPSEFLNSDYGILVKDILIKSKVLRHIITIDFGKNIFDDALTTASILLCANDEHYHKVKFSNINRIEELETVEDYIANYPLNIPDSTYLKLEDLTPDVKWRRYYQKQNGPKFKHLIPFSNVAKVVRGIATGDNNYFLFNKSKANQFEISDKYLLPCICKAIDIKNSFFTRDDLNKLYEADKQVFLLNAYGDSDINLKKYIEIGENNEVNKKYLTKSRNPWYSIENRPPAPIWVSVFNRTGLRFIRNEANISNLTTFHCIYPKNGLFDNLNIDILFAYLLTDIAKEIFEDNRREYGNGLQKFEPNDINKGLMLDLSLLDNKAEKEILLLFDKYRDSVLKSEPDHSILVLINDIFKNQYCVE